MKRYFVSFVIVHFFFANSVSLTDYCQLSCSSNKIHTKCLRKDVNCGASDSCGPNFKQIGLTQEDITTILDVHNLLRNKIATGKETIGNQPSASNMNALSYNKEMGSTAQCSTNTCIFAHDKCRRTAKYSWVGQNLGLQKYKGTIGDYKSVINSSIYSWYNEVAHFKAEWVPAFASYGVTVGHYTQAVWATTKEVGCGLTFFVENGWNTYIFGCNYGPGGNIIGASVYKKGEPATDCSGQAKNKNYPGLCGDVKINET